MAATFLVMRRKSGVDPLMSCSTTIEGHGPSPVGFSKMPVTSPLFVGKLMSAIALL